MSDKLNPMLVRGFTVADAASRLALPADVVDELIARHELAADVTPDGLVVSEKAIADFEAAEAERTQRGLEELARVSNEMGFID